MVHVHQMGRRFDPHLHEIDQVGAASYELGAWTGSNGVERTTNVGRALVSEGISSDASCVSDSGQDVRIGRAAAKIAAHPFTYLCVTEGWFPLSHVNSDVAGPAHLVFLKHAHRGANLARRAVAALKSVMLNERGLHRVHIVGLTEPFDSRYASPSCMQAKLKQLTTRIPFNRTVQAPHWPWSQPFLVPVRPRCSRSASSRVVRVSTARLRTWPFIDIATL